MRNLVVARLTEVAAKSEFIPMRTLITKAGGTAALRKMSHSKAANALKNAAKELQQERKAKGLGYKIDKTKAQEWLDTNAPKRTRGAEGTSKRPASKKTLSVDKMDARKVFEDTVRPNDVKKIARARSNKDKMIDNAAHDAVINTIIKEGKGDLLDNGGYEKLSKSPKFKALVEKVKNLIKEKVSSLTPAQKAKGTKPNPKPRGSSSESDKEGGEKEYRGGKSKGLHSPKPIPKGHEKSFSELRKALSDGKAEDLLDAAIEEMERGGGSAYDVLMEKFFDGGDDLTDDDHDDIIAHPAFKKLSSAIDNAVKESNKPSKGRLRSKRSSSPELDYSVVEEVKSLLDDQLKSFNPSKASKPASKSAAKNAAKARNDKLPRKVKSGLSKMLDAIDNDSVLNDIIKEAASRNPMAGSTTEGAMIDILFGGDDNLSNEEYDSVISHPAFKALEEILDNAVEEHGYKQMKGSKGSKGSSKGSKSGTSGGGRGYRFNSDYHDMEGIRRELEGLADYDDEDYHYPNRNPKASTSPIGRSSSGGAPKTISRSGGKKRSTRGW